MSIETIVTLYCDGPCNESQVYGHSITEVKAEAREKGWKLTSAGDFCGCHEDGWFDHNGMWMTAEEEERRRQQRNAIKETACTRCGAKTFEKCVTAGGKEIDLWFQSHADRLRAAGVKR